MHIVHTEGTQVVAAVGSRVLVYDALSGNLLHSLKAHHLPVYSVTYSSDGYRFASGGADNIVIVWTNKAEGSVKFSHNDSIQVQVKQYQNLRIRVKK